MNKVKKRIWTQKLLIGNNKNHKLIEIINDLDELIEYKKDRQEFAKILTKMTDHSLSHFKIEEASMEKMIYPLFDDHKNDHRDYIYKVAMFNVNLIGTNSPHPKDVIPFLENWWTNHIMTHDAKYEKFKINLI